MADTALELITKTEGLPIERALPVYASWILKHPKAPDLGLALYNYGTLLLEQGQLQEALKAFKRLILLAPKLPQARVNLAIVYERLGLYEDALVSWLDVEAMHATGLIDGPTHVSSLNSIVKALEALGRWDESLVYLNRSFSLDPTQDAVLYHLIRTRQRLCSWPLFEDLENVDGQRLRATASALAMLSISDDPQDQLDASARNMRLVIGDLQPSPPRQITHRKTRRLRVAYASSNFNFHPVSMLTAGLYELHNRDEFEVVGVCWSLEDGSQLRGRVLSAFDEFVPIGHLNDTQAATTMASLDLDILVDLQGLTSGARPGLFASRPAPIQVALLGHPGTSCVPGVDYIIADDYLIPPEFERFYSESVLRLGNCFQLNDPNRESLEPLSRLALSLPEEKFVYAAHNNTNKITPQMFDAWCQILTRTENTVLWVVADNNTAQTNLLDFVRGRGIDPSRVVFADRCDYTTYLRRLGAADLMLDTFPFNGGTTTSDALWMGLPVLTLSGRSFASRMSGSLLKSQGLEALVVDHLEGYIQKAVSFAGPGSRPPSVPSREEQTALFRSRIVDYEEVLKSVSGVLSN